MAERIRVAVSGSTGLIGEGVVSALRADGHRVQRLVRSREAAAGGDDVYWSVARGEIDAEALEGVDAVVHLAGEPIHAARWSPEVKQRIMSSRSEGTGLLAETLANLDDKPSVFVSGSAIHFYGNDRGEEILTEASAGETEGFLPEVVHVWEDSATVAAEAGIRVVHPRTGIVLDQHGGALGKMLPFFKLGVGGRIGSGRQWMSWISYEDQIRALRELIVNETLSGPVNLTGPAPARNVAFTKALGRVIHRPTVLPIPSFGPKILYGEMGELLALGSLRVEPAKLREAGFAFHHTDVESALRAAMA